MTVQTATAPCTSPRSLELTDPEEIHELLEDRKARLKKNRLIWSAASKEKVQDYNRKYNEEHKEQLKAQKPSLE